MASASSILPFLAVTTLYTFCTLKDTVGITPKTIIRSSTALTVEISEINGTQLKTGMDFPNG
nr:hypothetical protein Iba_chr01aCG10290 [Ipomoea batatas]